MDTNKDGVISKSEFKSGFRSAISSMFDPTDTSKHTIGAQQHRYEDEDKCILQNDKIQMKSKKNVMDPQKGLIESLD